MLRAGFPPVCTSLHKAPLPVCVEPIFPSRPFRPYNSSTFSDENTFSGSKRAKERDAAFGDNR